MLRGYRRISPDPGLPGGGPWAMAMPGIKRALYLTELSQRALGLWFTVIALSGDG